MQSIPHLCNKHKTVREVSIEPLDFFGTKQNLSIALGFENCQVQILEFNPVFSIIIQFILLFTDQQL